MAQNPPPWSGIPSWTIFPPRNKWQVNVVLVSRHTWHHPMLEVKIDGRGGAIRKEGCPRRGLLNRGRNPSGGLVCGGHKQIWLVEPWEVCVAERAVCLWPLKTVVMKIVKADFQIADHLTWPDTVPTKGANSQMLHDNFLYQPQLFVTAGRKKLCSYVAEGPAQGQLQKHPEESCFQCHDDVFLEVSCFGGGGNEETITLILDEGTNRIEIYNGMPIQFIYNGMPSPAQPSSSRILKT